MGDPNNSLSSLMEATIDIVAGTVGGVMGKLVEYPFDSIKTRMQAGLAGTGIKYKDSWDCFRRTIAGEGVRGLFKGMAAPLAGTVVETSCLFFTNGALKRALAEEGHLPPGADLPMKYVFICGAGTGFVVSWVLTPVELIKCRLQIIYEGSTGYKGPMDCLRKSINEEGLAVLYRGHVGTLLREIPGTALWFAGYEWFIRRMTPPGMSRDELPSSTIIAAGSLGGTAYWLALYPADTVKSVMQVTRDEAAEALHLASSPLPAAAGTPAGSATAAASAPVASSTAAAAKAATRSSSVSFMGTFMSLYRSTGVRGLYAGIVPTMLRAAPSNAAIFLFYEWSAKAMKEYIQRDGLR